MITKRRNLAKKKAKICPAAVIHNLANCTKKHQNFRKLCPLPSLSKILLTPLEFWVRRTGLKHITDLVFGTPLIHAVTCSTNMQKLLNYIKIKGEQTGKKFPIFWNNFWPYFHGKIESAFFWISKMILEDIFLLKLKSQSFPTPNFLPNPDKPQTLTTRMKSKQVNIT